MKYVNQQKSSLGLPLLTRALLTALAFGAVNGSTVAYWLLCAWASILALVIVSVAFSGKSVSNMFKFPVLLLAVDCVMLYFGTQFLPGVYATTVYGVMMIAFAYTIIFNRN